MKERSKVASFRSVVWKLTVMRRRSGAVMEYDPYVKKKKRYKYAEM
jgi:hypothetical protein